MLAGHVTPKSDLVWVGPSDHPVIRKVFSYSHCCLIYEIDMRQLDPQLIKIPVPVKDPRFPSERNVYD